MSDQDAIKKLLEKLHQQFASRNVAKCVQTIEIISEHFDEPLTDAQASYSVELLFKWDDYKISITQFLASTMNVEKQEKFPECNKKVFELIEKVIKLYPTKVVQFSKTIVDFGVMNLNSAKSSATEKESATQMIVMLIEQNAFDDSVDVSRLIIELIGVLNQKKPPMRLQQHVYELLGLLSKSFPNKFALSKGYELLNKMINTIQSLFKDDKAVSSLMVISGAVGGLSNHLINFTPTPLDDIFFGEKLYECMINLTDPEKLPSGSSSNRVPFRKMLQIVHLYAHVHNIPSLMFRDYKLWHKSLNFWMGSATYEDKSAGVLAMQTFHQVIALVLDYRRNDDDKNILLFFMNNFKKALESPESQPNEIRTAIKGFGSMAAVCKLLLEPKYLNELFDLVIQRTEYSYLTKDRLLRREVLEHLPNFIESLSKIMYQLDEISGIQLQSLESIVVVLIKDFHYLSTAHHSLVANALLETFINIQKLDGKILEKVLESVVWQGVLWTCSHQLVYDLQDNWENVKDWKETITYRKYLPLWQRLLAAENPDHQAISSIIYDHFIKDLFLVINKLDLSTQKRKYHDEANQQEQEFFFSDPSLDLEPVRAENFQILYNLVQFYSDVLLAQSNECLQENFKKKWLELWLEKTIKLSFKHPLVSGFLQLIEISLKIIDRLNLASDSDNTTDVGVIDSLKFYIKSMAFMRCLQTSGELQIACLQLIFQVPTTILEEFVEDLTPIYKTGFDVGKSMLPLAHSALTSFERLIDALSEDPKTRRQLLEEVLPQLESYLSSHDSGNKEIVRQMRGRKQNKLIRTETDLMRFKKRVLIFLGQFSPDEAQLILSTFEQKLVRDHVTSVFKIQLECDEDEMPVIYLDDSVLRICQLALTSSDRSTKIAASELLHALVVFMMGKDLHGSETLPLWKELCCNLIELGAENDQTVRQLFELLLMQMMHFFAQPSKILNPMTTAVIESLLTMICHKNNSGIQDLSARLLREFLLWVSKNTDRNQRQASPIKLVDLFYEMRKMSSETDASRRMGATLAFNNIYRIIREDEALIDVYWIYLLDLFAMNFKSSEDFSNDLDNNFADGRRLEQVSASMDHLCRVFVERSEIFKFSNSDRIRPSGFDGVSLVDVVNWLFKESGKPQYHYRHKLMQMFDSILPAWGTKQDFYEQNCSVERIIDIGERDGIKMKPDLSFLQGSDEPVFESIYKWLQSLLTTLDFYVWLVDVELIPSYEMGTFLSASNVLSAISYFIRTVVGKNILALVNSIDGDLINDFQLNRELNLNNRNIDNIASISSIVLVRVIDFLTTLIKGQHIAEFLKTNKTELLEITYQMIFNPRDLNLDFKSAHPLLKLRKRITNFVFAVNDHAPSDFKDDMMSGLTRNVIHNLNAMCQNPENFENLLNETTIKVPDVARLHGIDLVISNMKYLLGLEMFEGERLLNATAKALLVKLFDGITESNAGVCRPRRLSPSAKAFASNVLRLCLKIDVFLNKVLVFLFKETSLKISSSRSIRHGDLFAQTFKEPLFDFFTSMLSETIQLLVQMLPDETNSNRLRIFAILAELNEYIFDQHKENLKVLEENVTAMTAQWPTIIRVALEMDNSLNCVDLALINLVKHLAMTSPIDLAELGRKLEKFQSWLFGLLENRNNSLEMKSKAVILLPCVTDSSDKANEKLMEALDSIQTHMPLRSHEYVEGSLEQARLVALTKAFFEALLRSRSPVIYRFIINFAISDENYILESDLQSTQVEFIKSLSAKEQEVIVNQTFEAFKNEKFSYEIRLSFVSRFLLTIMKNCQVDVMMTFMRENMSAIWNLTESMITVNTGHSLVNRCGAYMMIEAFAALVPRDKIESASFNYGGKLIKGTDFIKELVKKARDVRHTITFMVDDAVQQELFRKFQCYCYRALAATVCNLSKEIPEVYNLALFKENWQKSWFIWQKLIDVRNEDLYANWAQDFAELPRIKEHILSVKDIQTVNESSSKRNYIDTISIFDRSLSQSLTKIDLANSVVLSNREALEREQLRREAEHQKTMRVQLESTPINDHEIMSVLVGVIQHIYQKKISPHTNLDKVDAKKFEWVVSLASSMRHPSNHKNVRIFLAKLVENCRSTLVHYAKQLTGAVLSVIVDGCLGSQMNFFIADLVTMLLSWSHIYKPTEFSEKQDACALLRFLMENAHHERDEIFKLNLELIKKLVELWSDVLREKIPTQTLLDLLAEPTATNNLKLRGGIQLNAVLLANDIVPWSNVDQQNIFIRELMKALDNTSPHVYQAAAQLIGMCLSKIDYEQNAELVEQISLRLAAIRKKSGNDVNVFLQILYGIQKAFPRILDQFMTLIKFNIPKAVRKIKCIYLEMFLARLEVEGEYIYREVVSIGTKDLLRQNEYQLLALHILNKALPHLKSIEFQLFIEELSALSQSSRQEIRRIVFEMMIYAIQTFQTDDCFNKTIPMRIVLKGFHDSDEHIQNRVTNFLSVEGALSTKFHERFLELLEKFYHPSLEKEFLHYSTQLLLDIPIRHPRSKKPLLAYDPSKDKDFFEYPITTKSNSQRSPAPMFIQSQQRTLLAGDGSMYNQLVRATQISGDNQMFAPTQDPIKMTQVSQTFAFKQTQDSLFFSLKPQFLDSRSQPCEAEKLDTEQEIAQNKERSKMGALDYLRKRIVRKDQQAKSKDFAMKAIDRRNFHQAKEVAKVRQSREGSEVVLYRRYRLGELPDFFFNKLAMLMPLQALAKKDDVVARDVFLSIFQSIVAILEEEEEELQASFFSSINNSIMNILKQSKNSDSFFIGTLIEMAMKSEKYLEISPEVLANVAAVSNMKVTGVLFLESQLTHLMFATDNYESEEQPIVKRQKRDIDTTQLKHWLKLIELYYKMNEYEIIVGIFTEKLDLLPEVRDTLILAIDQESKGKFADASKVYEELIRKGSARNNNEKEFFYQSYFNCLANLSDWRNIAKEIESQLGSYDEAWDVAIPFHQETFLPHLMKSELRLILDLKLDGGSSSNNEIHDEFLNILETWLNDEKKCEHLRGKFPEIVSMLHVVEEKFAEGSVETENALRNFCDEWSNCEMHDEKLMCLKEARNIAEIANFLSTITSPSQNMNKLFKSWKLSQPKTSDSLILWGDLLSYRRTFYELINTENRHNSAAYLLNTKRDLLRAAFAQKNSDAAKFIINDLKDDKRCNLDVEKICNVKLSVAKYNIMKSEDPCLEDVVKISKLYMGMKNLVEGVFNNKKSSKYTHITIEAMCCASEISKKLWIILEQNREKGVEIPAELQRKVKLLIESQYAEEIDVVDSCKIHAEEQIKAARALGERLLKDHDSPENKILLSEVYLKMGKFYHHIFSSGAVTSTAVQTKIIRSIFRAIAQGSDEAKVFIPYILQLNDLQNNSDLTDDFNSELCHVPEWMFIPYISQMLSSYDFENDCYLDGLLMKMAVKYPNALYFPFKLSRDHYRHMKENRGMEKELVARINDTISSPTMDRFMSALQCVVLPEKMLSSHFQTFDNMMSTEGKKLDNAKYQSELAKLHENAFAKNNELKGPAFKEIREFEKDIQALQKMNYDQHKGLIPNEIKKLREKINLKQRRSLKSMEMEKLCKWLSDYKWCGEKDFIEIPGQYSGEQKPFVEQHVKIVRFEQSLKIFSSKQQPIEIKVYGSDGRTYSFILKYGEDLRQDQRIQHILELMSRHLAMDKNCKQNHLKIHTYQVVPITASCGILSVVENAKTILDYLQDFGKHFFKTSLEDVFSKIREQFRNFLLGDEEHTSWQKTYEIGLSRKRREELVEEIKAKEAVIPIDIIRKLLMHSAMTLETYYILRRNFIMSLAAMNIAHWLLGIGDRHLGNILIDTKTGRLIGIDFGLAFGAAANLAVPELVPFRLTSHFVNVIEPLGIDGMIKKNMINVLRCLRDYRETILICLEMFVNEPTMDWLMRSRVKSVGNVGADSSLVSSDWNPEARVRNVRRKLEGVNPVQITKDELSISDIANNPTMLRCYEDLADGGNDALRVKMKDDELSVEDQVTCLIEMATDKALLASVYLGFDPWF